MSGRHRAITPFSLSIAAVLLLLFSSTSLTRAELLTHKDLTLAVAKTIAETAIGDCKAKGYTVEQL